jgi:hypothetical protein
MENDELDKRFAELAERYRHYAEELEQARGHIEKQDGLSSHQALLAFNRAADAITDGIKVFISYKSEDEALAKSFRRMIVKYGASRLKMTSTGTHDVFYAAQGIGPGDDWEDTLDQKLSAAHWLILLLPDGEVERDWRVWEAGYFAAHISRHAGERLICVHHPSVRASPQLTRFQSRSGDERGIKKFFEEMFFSPNVIPGMKQIAARELHDDLESDAKLLACEFGGPAVKPQRDYFIPYLSIAIDEKFDFSNMTDLLKAKVIGCAKMSRVFDIQGGFRGTVNELLGDSVARGWIEPLVSALHDVVKQRNPRSVWVPIASHHDNGKQYRPVVASVERQGDDRISSFQILFIEEIGGQITRAPEDLDALETALRWCYRSWWEIYHRSGGDLSDPKRLDQMKQYIRRSEWEAQLRGALNPETLQRAFDRHPELQERLGEHQERYRMLYRNDKDGKLDTALSSNDGTLMSEALKELRPMIAWFLVNAAHVYADMLAEELKSEVPVKKADEAALLSVVP